ncbi:MAG: PhnD/SsuA/transferrin family substrate-binding protein [Desulfopila sp.]
MDELRFGVISLNHPLIMFRQYLPFTDFLTDQLSTTVSLYLAKDYRSIVEALVRQEIHFALLAGVSFVDASLTSEEITPVCSVLSADGSLAVRSVFITRGERDDIDTLPDLVGKSFAFGSPESTSSYLKPLGYLYHHGISPDKLAFFDNLPTQDAVIRSVLRGTHDAGAVSTGAAARFKEAGLKEIAVTDSYPGFVIVASPLVPPELRKKLQTILLNLDYSDAEVASLVVRWSPLLRNGFAPTPEAAYTSIFQLMTELHEAGIYR